MTYAQDSIGVSHEDYLDARERGRDALDKYLRPVNRMTRGLAYAASLEPWGGITVDTRTQLPVEPTKGFAIAVPRQSDIWSTINVAREGMSEAQFTEAYDRAMTLFASAPYVGIFNDKDLGVIQFDPVIIVDDEMTARDILTFTEPNPEESGGAYDFSTGNGVFPFHVMSTSKEIAA